MPLWRELDSAFGLNLCDIISERPGIEEPIENICNCGCVYMCAHLFFILKGEAYGQMLCWMLRPCVLNNLCPPCLLLVPFTLMTGLTLMYINLQHNNVALDCFQVQIALKSNKNTWRHKSFAASSDRIHTRPRTNSALLVVNSFWFYWSYFFDIALVLKDKMWKIFWYFLLQKCCSEAVFCIHLNSLPPTWFVSNIINILCSFI